MKDRGIGLSFFKIMGTTFERMIAKFMYILVDAVYEIYVDSWDEEVLYKN